MSLNPLLPTLMRIAGIKNHGGKPFDGLDVFDVLTGRKTALDREIYSYIGQSGEDNEQITCITPEWKLVVIGPNVNDATADDSKRQKLLFRIADDPYEKNDVSADHPDVVEQLMRKVKAFRALQPAGGVPPYNEGRKGFKAPKEWSFPDA